MKRRCMRSPHSTIETRSRGGRAGNRDPSHRGLRMRLLPRLARWRPRPVEVPHRRGTRSTPLPGHHRRKAPRLVVDESRPSLTRHHSACWLAAATPRRRVDLEKEREERMRGRGRRGRRPAGATGPASTSSARASVALCRAALARQRGPVAPGRRDQKDYVMQINFRRSYF